MAPLVGGRFGSGAVLVSRARPSQAANPRRSLALVSLRGSSGLVRIYLEPIPLDSAPTYPHRCPGSKLAVSAAKFDFLCRNVNHLFAMLFVLMLVQFE